METSDIKPIILTQGQYTIDDIKELKGKCWTYKDIYTSQLAELFEIQNPSLTQDPSFDEKKQVFINDKTLNGSELSGNYIYYPYSGLLLRTVNKETLRVLRTNRTNNLITPEEQTRLSNFTAGVAGLSFGNGIALSLAYTGASDTIKIADNDIFETTNLNRVRVGLPSVMVPKTQVTAQDIYEINPYANVQTYEDGLSEDNLEDFFNGTSKLDIIYDVVDDLAMKVRIRIFAKKYQIPVVMLTSLEDSILVDVERYDLNPDAEIFHGLLGSVTDELLTKEMTEADKARYAMRIVGPENISYRNLKSLAGIGTELVSRPHLYGTVSIVCGLASYIIKRIALEEDLPSIRKLVKFNDVLGIAENSDDTDEARHQMLSHLMGSGK